MMYVLDKKVDENFHTIVETTFARYMSGDRSMIIEVDLNSTVPFFNAKPYGDILSLHYNFKPPTCVYTNQ